MSQVISKPSLGEQFLAEIYSQPNGKSSLNLQDFHAEFPIIVDTMRSSMVKTKKKPGTAHLQIVYYNCAHCDSIASHSCVKKHRHQIEAFTKEEFEVLCEAYMQKKKLKTKIICENEHSQFTFCSVCEQYLLKIVK